MQLNSTTFLIYSFLSLSFTKYIGLFYHSKVKICAFPSKCLNSHTFSGKKIQYLFPFTLTRKKYHTGKSFAPTELLTKNCYVKLQSFSDTESCISTVLFPQSLHQETEL